MSQVLEAPVIQDEEREPIAIVTDGSPTTAKTRQPVSVLHAIMSVVARPRSQPIRACADTTAQYESVVDHLCRVEPYLYIKSLGG